MDSALAKFRTLMSRNLKGGREGIYSVCSSHPYAIRAALVQAEQDNSIALIESTSNQVNQRGGYTGMRPTDFKQFVLGIASELGFPQERILFGGDHLGPFPWHREASEKVLPLAEEMVCEYVKAGYQKIHLDVSMYLGDDDRSPGKPLSPDIVARRTASMCAAAERTWKEHGSQTEAPVYIIGNEVPVPGGTSSEQGELRPSVPSDVADFVDSMHQEFKANNLDEAWERVAAVVVQPGVEFGDDLIHEYKPEESRGLVSLIDELPGMVYEAHSTDYQLPSSLSRLVADHFAILKVGPAMTFAFREAVVALEQIEKALLCTDQQETRSNLLETVVTAMREDDRYWKNYYQGDKEQVETAIRYSFSDRIRYYWTTPAAVRSFSTLLRNLNSRDIPLTLISQYLPRQYEKVRSGAISPSPEELILSHIQEVTAVYAAACNGR